MASAQSIRTALTALKQAGFSPPSDADGRAMMAVWMDALRDLDDEALLEGVRAFVGTATNSFWPVPGQIRDRAAGSERRALRLEAETLSHGCKACNETGAYITGGVDAEATPYLCIVRCDCANGSRLGGQRYSIAELADHGCKGLERLERVECAFCYDLGVALLRPVGAWRGVRVPADLRCACKCSAERRGNDLALPSAEELADAVEAPLEAHLISALLGTNGHTLHGPEVTGTEREWTIHPPAKPQRAHREA